MIRPMLPELYPFDFTDAGFFISATMMIAAAVIVSLFSAGYAARAFHGDKKKTALCFAGIAVCAALSLICFLDVLQLRSRAFYLPLSSHSALTKILRRGSAPIICI